MNLARFPSVTVLPAAEKVQGGLVYSNPPGAPASYVGVYIVTPELRGQNIGTRLWKAMVDQLDPEKPMVLRSSRYIVAILSGN